jgi:hypothetical protein
MVRPLEFLCYQTAATDAMTEVAMTDNEAAFATRARDNDRDSEDRRLPASTGASVGEAGAG